ncbi:hypothetical protein NBRC116598_34480 [Pseudophaeobacter arcticus]|uniref:Calx-beta domain-containing protein n=1 Tax=Pseudophaeobacter arcticus TaxID=385492 RepID=A0ABQ0AQ43_9RHOB
MTDLLRRVSHLLLASFLLLPGLVQAQSAPSFSAVFSPDSITSGNNSTLTLTITEISGLPASDLTVSAALPAGVTVTGGSQSNTCNGTFTAVSGSSSLSLSEGRLGASQSCVMTLPVTSSTVATHTLVTGDLTSSLGNSGTATDDLTVTLPTPVFSHSFAPSTVNPGDISTLTYTIDNSAGALDIFSSSFDETLPSGLALTTPASVVNNCGGSIQVTSGGNNVDVDSVSLAAGASCTITVDVEALSLGDQVTSSTLFSTFSNFSNSQVIGTGTLVVEAAASNPINFSKRFSVTQVGLSQNVTLSFTLQNTSRDDAATNIAFTDDLDAMLSGLTATSLPASGFCGAGSTISGSSSLTISGATLAAGDSCNFDVTLLTPAGAATGDYTNTTSTLSADIGSSPYSGTAAQANLRVLGDGGQGAVLSKSFINNPTTPGTNATLRYTVSNPNASFALSDIAFSDVISDITGAADVTIDTLPSTGSCGVGSNFFQSVPSADSFTFNLSGGVIAAGSSCVFDLLLDVETTATPGSYSSTSGDVTSTVNGGSVITLGASDTLQVAGGANLTFTQVFSEDRVGAGDTATLTFTITSAAESPSTATGLTFSNDLSTFLSGATFGITSNSCGGSAALSAGNTLLSYSGGSLAPGDSCTVVTAVSIPGGSSNGTYASTSSTLTGMAGGEALVVPLSSDDLQVLEGAPLEVSKSLAPSAALPGETITLTYTLTNPDPTLGYTSVFFTESYSSALSSLAIVPASLPAGGFCGGSGSASGTTFGLFSSIEVPANGSCVFSVDLLVPAGASDGSYALISSNVTGTLNGTSVTLPTMNDTLTVQGAALSLVKSYASTPTAPGDTVTAEYTLTNLSSTHAIDSIIFSDDLDAQLSGLTSSSGTLSDICGAGSALSGSSTLSFSGGTLAAGASCSFDVTQLVPGGASAGTYPGLPGNPSGQSSGLAVGGSAIPANLTVSSTSLPSFSKSFTDPALVAGGSTTLTYVITNTDPSASLTALRFSDDLDAVLSGLVVSAGTGSDLCGSGSSVSGTGLITLTGGELAPSASCTIALTVSLPGSAPSGSYSSTSGDLSAGGSFAASGATDSFSVEPAPGFAQALSPATIAQGGVTTATFTIDNSASALAANSLDVSNTLPAGLVVAPTPNASVTCTGGTATAVPGGSVISYTGGTVGAGASCTISLDLRATAVGSLVNTTGDLTSGLGNSGTTTDTLTVTAAPAPGFTKGFASSTIVQGASTSLGFTIDNSSALIEASSLDFTDSLPAGLVVADSPNAASNCTGGTLTATAGSSSISYTGGSVTAAASCQISVDVTAATVGALANTSGDLTSSLGNSGTASDTLTVTAAPAPSFAKSFDDSSVTLGANTTLTFSIDNSTALIAATALDFTDTLPAGLTVASTPNASSTCTGGTLTATAGAGSISYTGGSVSAAASCVIIVDVTTSGSGTLVNTTGDLTSSLGNSGTATASLKVATLGFDSPLSGDDIVNAAEATTVTLSGTTSLIEDGQSVSVSVTDSASGTASGSATVSSDAWSLVIDLSGLSDGSLNLTADVSDAAGTPTPQASASLTLDTDQPALSFDNPLAGDNIVSAAEAGSLTISGGAAGLVDGRSVSLVITDSASATVSGSTTVSSDSWSLVVDLSGLSDGTLSLTADATDAAGNPVDQASASLELDLNTPSGYSASFDQDPVNSSNEAAASFTFASAEVGALYDYSISSDGGGSPVSGSGTIASASEQITGLDLSGLGDGILTLSVTLTDSAGQAGSAASNTAAKDTSRPTVTLTGPTTAQSSAFVVSLTFDTSVTGLAEADFTIDGGTASGLTGSGTSYSVTVTPDHDGTMTITLPVDSAVSATGNGNEISNVLSVEADLTGTPDPTPPADADGDGIPDNLESSTADRDGDGIVDSADYDPQGYFYCEDNGNILSGGGITVTGPSGSNSSVGISNNINIVRDGSTGEYQWFALVPGSYSVSYSYPATGVASTTRLSSGTLDVTSLLPANPAVLGSTQVGSTGVLADPSLAANPVFYDTFVIEAGDPDVLANNIPMTNCSAVITVSASDNGAEANGAATDSANFTISQTVATTLDSVISYTLTGTATSGADYTAPSGSVTIPAGATSALVDLPVLEDGLIEGDETVILTLTSVTSASAGVALSTTASELTRSATVTDDDFAVIAVSNDDLTATEGGSDTAAMSFVLLGQPTQDVVLSFAGDAQCSVSPAQATFTSANYASAQTLTITAIDDTIVEGTHSCQPTVTVTSTDTAFDGFGLALAQVVVTDDLIDQIRTPLTEILKNDLEDTVGSQQRHFSGIAKGALARLQAGEAGLGCGTLASFDVDGSINTQGDTGGSDGTFGYDVYNCGTGSRDILAGSFSLTRTENIGTQALVQFSRQRERFLSESDLRGRFWGGYLSRTNVTGLADGAIHGVGVNGGLYGARQLGDGLFLDYYAAGGFGHHRFDLSFANAGGAIQADGSYDYAAAYAGVALSGRHQRDKLLIIPRVGLDLAYALAGDADVTATQLGLSSTGSIDIPDYNGGRFFAEVEIAGLGSQDGDNPRAISRLMSLTPRVICEVSSYDSGLGCGLGLNFSQELFNPATGLIFSFEIDYESVDDTDRLSVDFHRERRFANGAGAVVTRLSMPSTATLKVEHGLRLDF